MKGLNLLSALIAGRRANAARLAAAVGVVALLGSCGGRTAAVGDYTVAVYEPRYATGFEIMGAEGMESVIITTKTPWQGAEGLTTSLFVARHGEQPPAGFSGAVIAEGARRVVCMSSSYVAMLDAIGSVEAVVGVSGIDYVSNPYVAGHRDSIGDVGYEGNVDYERLLSLDPDLVLLYGVAGASAMEGKLRELGIAYAYVGEYLEESPLGKAEWLVAVAEMAGRREAGERAFQAIPARYEALRQRVAADSLTAKPRVMINAPYGDAWVMASTGSYVARLIADAGGEYVYGKDTSSSSLSIDAEEAYRLASEANVWINVGAASTLAELRRMAPNFGGVGCVKAGRVYNNNRRLNAHGGNDYWESGVVNPDLVLRDLVGIFHPGAVDDAELVYYKRLE